MTYGYEGEEEYIPTPEELASLDRSSATTSVLGIELTPLRLGVLVGGFGLVLVLIFVVIHLKPKLSELQTVEADVNDKTRRLDSANQQIDSLSNIQSQIGAARELNTAISALLPTPENVETQLLEVNRLVSQNNLQLQSFVPGQFEAAGDDVPAAIQPQLQRSRTAVIVESNSYSQGIELMNSIERLETLFRVSDLTMTIDPDNDTQRTEFNLDAFVFDSSVPPIPASELLAPEEEE